MPNTGKIIDLRILPHERMSLLYNALDLILVPNEPGHFGDACFPIKLAEALACHRPLLAARTRSVHDILGGQDRFLYDLDDPCEFSTKARSLLVTPSSPVSAIDLSWESLRRDFSEYVAFTIQQDRVV